eukprot:m.169687 g.169687  ORF g.169687 m.169687 type:complete len:74 (+) comp31582_c1_seq1:1460-1681(+)
MNNIRDGNNCSHPYLVELLYSVIKSHNFVVRHIYAFVAIISNYGLCRLYVLLFSVLLDCNVLPTARQIIAFLY